MIRKHGTGEVIEAETAEEAEGRDDEETDEGE